MNKLAIVRKYFNYKRQDRVNWAYNFKGALNRTVVEIPARSGSTRIKDKNIHEVCGLPLMAYTIRFALKLKGVDRVIVNTDSPRYAAIAREHGAEVPFLRPPEMSGSSANSSLATFFLKRFLMDEDYPLKKIVTLFPTSPFRNKQVVESIMDKLNQFQFTSCGFFPDTTMDALLKENREGRLHSIDNYEPEQHPMSFFKTTGMLSGFNIVPSMSKKRFVHIINSPVELIDIDDEEDLKSMRVILENNAYDFGCRI